MLIAVSDTKSCEFLPHSLFIFRMIYYMKQPVSLNSINPLVSVMEADCNLFEVRTV
jgi:hypothetical protein